MMGNVQSRVTAVSHLWYNGLVARTDVHKEKELVGSLPANQQTN